MKMFLDNRQPLHTCKEDACAGCDVKNSISCHFGSKQLILFFSLAVPLLILGGIGTALFTVWALAAWLLFVLSYFGLIEVRVMCSHCPHYAEPGSKTLKCWANYGAPKLWAYRPGPMTLGEEIVFFSGLLVVFLFPVLSMLYARAYWLLAVYAVLAAVLFIVLRTFYCGKCMNFACPLNRVDQDVRYRFNSHRKYTLADYKKEREN